MEKYIITSYRDDFYTGKTGDERQVLMGLLCPELVAIFFDVAGDLLQVESRALTCLPPRQRVVSVSWETNVGIQSLEGPRPGPFQLFDPHFQDTLARDLAAWKREIRFQETPITVREFFLNDRYLGIRRLPDHLAEFRENPDLAAESEEERREVGDRIREWESLGQFVLWWGKDYYVNRDGDVEST
jgi:hypothetical protein